MRRLRRSFGVRKPFVPLVSVASALSAFRYPSWLSDDGVVIWGGHGSSVVQSTNDWLTRTAVGDALTAPGPVKAVRPMQDGELLVGTGNSVASEYKSELWRSSGYDRANPSAATWAKVHEAGTLGARFDNPWGFSVSGSIVVASEYGLRGNDGARRVYLSTNSGVTFAEVFDIMTTPLAVSGAPTPDENAHIHSAAYDPHHAGGRIWVTTGDSANTATYYSDDLGSTWTLVAGSESWQATSILPLPDRVLLGSDANPDGVWRIERGVTPALAVAFGLDDRAVLTYVGQLAFQRTSAHPALFGFTWAQSDEDGSGVIVMTDALGEGFYCVWHDSFSFVAAGSSVGVHVALGPTASGNLVWTSPDPGGESQGRVNVAPFPELPA